MADCNSPRWREGVDAETIHARMMAQLPEDIDKTEAGFPWDFTKPTALEIAEMLEFHMVEAVKIMFPQFAYGSYLDYHAEAAGTSRKSAVCAEGEVLITGTAGTTIPQGFLFAVPSSNGSEAITFATDEEVTIDEDGTATVSVTASVAGTNGNVDANTIVIMVTPIADIGSVTNLEATSGGTDEEDDDELRERIAEIYASKESFVGCDSDYVRWAKEVAGVGEVTVIAEWEGAGTVKIVVFDSNGDPASESILEAVYDYIVSPNDRSARLAPIGATVSVSAPEKVSVDVAFTLKVDSGYDYDTIVEMIKTNISDYLSGCSGTVKRNMIGSLIIATDGVSDYSDLTLNGGTSNISIAEDEYAVFGEYDVTNYYGDYSLEV